ncbi:ABC transporter permease [Alicyclobacillus sacchari]|nr:ABC transporter permease [Alicyclobacillus sacchari]
MRTIHQSWQRVLRRREATLVGFMTVMLLVLMITSPSFLAPSNLINVLLNTVTIGILALGECAVIITKGIDLSVGSTMGLVTLAVGTLILSGIPVWVSLAIGLALGLLAGCVNGIMVSLVKLPPIIVTLGTLSVYSGLMYTVTNGQWIQNLPSSLSSIGNFKIWFLPGPVFILLMCLVFMSMFLQRTITGRYVYAVGNNVTAARLAGVQERRIIFIPYAITGVLAAIAGILYLAYNGFATPTTGSDLNLEAIAAAVIGGTNVFGGKGTALGAVLGAILLGIISEALVFFHLPAVWNEAAEGFIILVAVISDSAVTKRAAPKGRVVS